MREATKLELPTLMLSKSLSNGNKEINKKSLRLDFTMIQMLNRIFLETKHLLWEIDQNLQIWIEYSKFEMNQFKPF
jgi:hypothetical protein